MMLTQVVSDQVRNTPWRTFEQQPAGTSAAPKALVFHALPDVSQDISVLDIGFGNGNLGVMIKQNPATLHWRVDGIDGWEVNCYNDDLVTAGHYRNIWHGLAQDMPANQFNQYDLICLLDVIEHLDLDTARWLFRYLLMAMAPHSRLMISTPLWFYPQDKTANHLEEHLIGVPASSMLACNPVMYAIGESLVGAFVYDKNSLPFADFFSPTTAKTFNMDMGSQIARNCGMNLQPYQLVKLR